MGAIVDGSAAEAIRVLGIETSCDDTAAAVVDGRGVIRAEAVRGQGAEHRAYGGVVPEIAARAHVERLDRLIRRVTEESSTPFASLSAVAVTAGPGLIGGLVVGVVTARTIASVHRLPLIAVNHLEGHALTARLTHGIAFPYLLLLLSGGHCQTLAVEGVGRYRRLGTTLDDALGEAFDKVAKRLGLGYPGGPAVERAAQDGDPGRFPLPRPLMHHPSCHFSFSGLKTAVRQVADRLDGGGGGRPGARDVDDLCAAFQAAAFDAVADRVARAASAFATRHPAGRHLVVAGGVAANAALRRRLEATAAAAGLSLAVPPPSLCTDNGVMIAWAGVERLRAGLPGAWPPTARARWPLDPHAETAIGAGVKA